MDPDEPRLRLARITDAEWQITDCLEVRVDRRYINIAPGPGRVAKNFAAAARWGNAAA